MSELSARLVFNSAGLKTLQHSPSCAREPSHPPWSRKAFIFSHQFTSRWFFPPLSYRTHSPNLSCPGRALAVVLSCLNILKYPPTPCAGTRAQMLSFGCVRNCCGNARRWQLCAATLRLLGAVLAQPEDSLVEGVRASLSNDEGCASAVLAPLALDASTIDQLWRQSGGSCDARVEVRIRHVSGQPFCVPDLGP